MQKYTHTLSVSSVLSVKARLEVLPGPSQDITSKQPATHTIAAAEFLWPRRLELKMMNMCIQGLSGRVFGILIASWPLTQFSIPGSRWLEIVGILG